MLFECGRTRGLDGTCFIHQNRKEHRSPTNGGSRPKTPRKNTRSRLRGGLPPGGVPGLGSWAAANNVDVVFVGFCVICEYMSFFLPIVFFVSSTIAIAIDYFSPPFRILFAYTFGPAQHLSDPAKPSFLKVYFFLWYCLLNFVY